MNFWAVILILKMEEDVQHFLAYYALFFPERETQMQPKHRKRFVRCMEKVLWLMEHVKTGLWSFLVLLTFWPNNFLLSLRTVRGLAALLASTQ